MERKILVLAVAAMVVVASVAAVLILKDDGPGENPTIVLGIADKNGYEPMIYAHAAGFFEDEKVNVDVKWENTGGTATTSLLAGQIDMTNAGNTPVFQALQSSTGVRIVASNCGQIIGESTTVFIVQNSSTADLSNLKGTFFDRDGNYNGTTKIAMDATSGYYNSWTSYVDWAATEEGLTTQQVEILKLKAGGAIFNSQDMHNVAISMLTQNPAAEIIMGGSDVDVLPQAPTLLKYLHYPTEFLTSTVDSSGCGVYIVSEKAYETNKEGILRALKAIKRAADILNNPQDPQFNDAITAVSKVVRGGTSDEQKAKEISDLATRYWGVFLIDDVLDNFNKEEVKSPGHKDGFDAWASFAPEFLKEIYGDKPYTFDRFTGEYVANRI